MNIQQLIDAMTPEEKQLASKYLWELHTEEANKAAKSIKFTEDEIYMMKNRKTIEAIKSVRARLGVDLLVAKAAVDQYYNDINGG